MIELATTPQEKGYYDVQQEVIDFLNSVDRQVTLRRDYESEQMRESEEELEEQRRRDPDYRYEYIKVGAPANYDNLPPLEDYMSYEDFLDQF
jgi:hypothetical protein